MADDVLLPTPTEEQPKLPEELPVLPLRDVVVYPYVILPLSVSREKSIRAVDTALVENRMILLLSQKQVEMDNPRPEDLYQVGTAALIMRVLKLPDGRIRALVQGLQRVRVEYFTETENLFKARVEPLGEPDMKSPDLEQDALLRSVKQTLEKAVALGKTLPQEVLVIAGNGHVLYNAAIPASVKARVKGVRQASFYTEQAEKCPEVMPKEHKDMANYLWYIKHPPKAEPGVAVSTAPAQK